MPRRKIAMRFIDNTRARAATYASRTKGLRKKAEELATLCSVPVALVVCAAAGAGAAQAPPLVWESREGVLDRYRALPPEVRAQHTHRGYLEADLGKERAKHARVRQHGLGALADSDAALLNGMTLDEARELLEAVEAALVATTQRMEALGLPMTTNDVEGGQELEQFTFPDGLDSAMMPGVGGNPLVDMDAGFQLQMLPYHGNNEFAGQLEQPFSWDDRLLPMQQRNGEMMAQPASYGFQCTDANYLGAAVATNGGYGQQMQPPVYGNADHYGWTDLAMWNTTDESCNAALPPVGCYPSLGSGTDGVDFIGSTAVPQHSALVTGGGNYINVQPLGYAMGNGMGVNLASQQADCYATHHWSAEEFQRADTGSTSLQAATSTWTRSSSDEAFNYLQ